MTKRLLPAALSMTVTLTASLAALTVPSSPAAAAADIAAIQAALNSNAVMSSTLNGDPAGIAVGTAPISGFPTAGGSYLVLSTGNADALAGIPATFSSTDLAGNAGADGNDLTQVRLHIQPPANATCFAFDFAFLSEEYPEFVGSSFNDIFTAELNDSLFQISGNQVVAPNNFAYDSVGNPVSINTVFGMAAVPGTTMDGSTPALTATSPVENLPNGAGMDLILSVQDLGDSVYDSDTIIDNLRFGNGPTCNSGTVELTDTDGDNLPDDWETNGVDIDSNGTVDVDLPAMGANPNHKDLFIEVDHMVRPNTSCIWFVCWGGKDFGPDQSALNDVRNAFNAAPVGNPDGNNGIRAHIDSGPNSIMNPGTGATWGNRSRAGAVPYTHSLGSYSENGYNWSAYESLKSSSMDLARREVFHYALYADTYAGSQSSGISRGIVAGDFLLTDGDPSWEGGFTRTQERGTFMHELGHGLGLRHGGDTNESFRAGYNSIMSYAYQLIGTPPNSGLDYSRTSPFVDWTHLRFDGGSIGARGDTAVIPEVTPDDEPTPQELKDANAFATPGDGLVTFAGPSVLLPGTGTSNVSYDITNVSTAAETFTVATTFIPAGASGTTTATVPAGATMRVTLPVNTAVLTPGTLEVTATLSSITAGNGLSQSTDSITVPDMNDPAVRADAQAALTQLGQLPANSGIDPAVLEQITNDLTTALGNDTPSWVATLTVRGDLAARYTSQLSEAKLTPTVSAPTRVVLSSAAGQPVLSVNLVKTKKSRPYLVGSMQFLSGTKQIATHVDHARFNGDSLVLTGAWYRTTKPSVNGYFRIVLAKASTP